MHQVCVKPLQTIFKPVCKVMWSPALAENRATVSVTKIVGPRALPVPETGCRKPFALSALGQPRSNRVDSSVVSLYAAAGVMVAMVGLARIRRAQKPRAKLQEPLMRA